jgi:hypothetical protein
MIITLYQQGHYHPIIVAEACPNIDPVGSDQTQPSHEEKPCFVLRSVINRQLIKPQSPSPSSSPILTPGIPPIWFTGVPDALGSTPKDVAAWSFPGKDVEVEDWCG